VLKTKTIWTYIVAILGVLLGAVVLGFTHVDGPLLDRLFGIQPGSEHDLDRIQADLSVSLAIMLISTLIGMFFLLADGKDELAKEVQKIRASFESLPQTRAFSAFETSDEGLSYLARRLPDAKRIYNTRLVRDQRAMDTTTSQHSNDYARAFVKAMEKGAYAYELVSPAWEARCEDLRTKHRGHYTYSIWRGALPTFLNFIVLEYGVDSEVLFGWLSLAQGGFDHRCFRTTEPRIVELFKSWHKDLLSDCKPTGDVVPAS
jgi:hypothetical protein